MPILIALLLLSLQSHATTLAKRYTYYPEQFYSAVESGLRGAELKSTLQEILSSAHRSSGSEHDQLGKGCDDSSKCYRHTPLGYRRARQILFGEIHLEETPDGYGVFDVYCEKTMTRKDFPHNPPGPGKIPDPNVMNAEHTWPQSRFNSSVDREMQKSDLHILYPVSSNANSMRGNIEFAEVITRLKSPCPKSERGYSEDGSRQQYFEVPANHKGNVARAIFYFATRYHMRVSPQEENSLRAWHRSDPADEQELKRNETVFHHQRVRNPFIDHPELVELISDF